VLSFFFQAEKVYPLKANKGLVTETEKNEFCARKSRKLENLKQGKVKKRHSKNKSNKNISKKADKVSE